MEDGFEIVSPIEDTETIAVSGGIRELDNLRKLFGKGRWKKLEGFAIVRFANGVKYFAELHWYEAHGIGRRTIKIKQLIRKLK